MTATATIHATHSEIEETLQGYRVKIYCLEKQIASKNFDVPAEYYYHHSFDDGTAIAYENAKQYCADFDVD